MKKLRIHLVTSVIGGVFDHVNLRNGYKNIVIHSPMEVLNEKD